jgi:hypothetical protein
VAGAYWLASALWHCSLVFSILGILLSAQQAAALDLMGELPGDSTLPFAKATVRRYLRLILSEMGQHGFQNELRTARSEVGVWKPRWKMVFTWQCPIMLMSYSVCLFLAGLTILICTPLIRGGEWSTDSNVSSSTFVAAPRDVPGSCAFVDVR